MAPVTILRCMSDPRLFGRQFAGPSWDRWRVLLQAVFALPLSDDDLAIYQHHTGRTTAPAAPFREVALIVGRRGGKSLVLALIAVFLACFRSYAKHLTVGERGVIAIVAADRRQCQIILGYVKGLLQQVSALAAMIERELAESTVLNNGVTIEIHTGSIGAPRGRTFVACLCDEQAFWSSDTSAHPDQDVIAAIRPGLASIPGSVLLMASSPYWQRGVLYSVFRKHFGQDNAPTLVWRGTTEEMNSTIDAQFIADAREEDPQSAAAEYDAQFRTDVAAFVAREVVDAVTIFHRYELPPVPGVKYFAFVDPSGGSSDSMTLAISHRFGDAAVLDCTRECRPPFSPENVVMDFATLLKTYNVREVVGDRYAGEWPRERFREHGIQYEASAKTKSDIYKDALPGLNSGRIELLDIPRLTSQLCSLERRTARGGRDSIDHGPGGHDDVANAAAGALLLATKPKDVCISMDIGQYFTIHNPDNYRYGIPR